MKSVILATASVIMVIDTMMASMVLMAQSVSPGTDSSIAPAGWASAATLGTITIWLFKRDWDRERGRAEDTKTHADLIKAMNEAYAKAMKEKDEAASLERKSLAEMYVNENAHNRISGQTIADKSAAAFLESLDRQHKHCIKHIDKHFEGTGKKEG